MLGAYELYKCRCIRRSPLPVSIHSGLQSPDPLISFSRIDDRANVLGRLKGSKGVGQSHRLPRTPFFSPATILIVTAIYGGIKRSRDPHCSGGQGGELFPKEMLLRASERAHTYHRGTSPTSPGLANRTLSAPSRSARRSSGQRRSSGVYICSLETVVELSRE